MAVATTTSAPSGKNERKLSLRSRVIIMDANMKLKNNYSPGINLELNAKNLRKKKLPQGYWYYAGGPRGLWQRWEWEPKGHKPSGRLYRTRCPSSGYSPYSRA